MSITDLEYYFSIFYFGLFVFGGVLIVPMLLVMHFLMPKAAIREYFKPPYFKDMEIELFTGIPYAPMRTVMFMAAFAFPKLGKKRKMTDAYLLAPMWYRVLSKFFCISIIFVFINLVIMTVGFIAYYTSTGEMKW